MKKLTAGVGVFVAALIAVVLLTSGSSTPQAATGSVHPAGWGATPPGFVAPPSLPTAVPTATMFDAVVVGNIPARPYAAAGYTAGTWPTYLALRRAWPQAHTISVAIQAQYHAACLDDEPGDATPAQAGPWVLADIRAGFAWPCVYGDLSEMPAIQASLRASLGSNWRTRVFLWLAWYRGFPGLVAGYDAVQYSDACLGRNLDCSTVTLDFLRAAVPPYVAPKPKPAPQPLPVCFSHREAVQTCTVVRTRIASDLRAAVSSNRALTAGNMALRANKCQVPYRRGVCIHKGHDASVFRQRVRFFSNAAERLKVAN